MNYHFSYQNPYNHLVDVVFTVDNITAPTLELQLPAWRPGRYELGNFARNIQRFAIYSEGNKPLPFKKLSKDKWLVETHGENTIQVKYNYYAYQLDAGACWLDEHQLYLNPIHCCLYVPNRMEELCTLNFTLPNDYEIATSMVKRGKHTLMASNYHELVDSPLIASASLQHNTFEAEGVLFHIWLQGECKPDWERILEDFKAYTIVQMQAYGAFPVKEYHYLMQVTPYKHYHGVEHLANTVIAIGPGYNLMKKEVYTDFLGVCAHELYHAWNIKSIRPIEMHPYDYTRENYSCLGHVAEGVTTYYGDLMLARSGVYTVDEYFDELNARINKHLHNYGRFNMSVAQASFDTWLDGYVVGIPNRKTSIYDEGCLIALMTDLLIRKHTENSASLDDVMKHLYHEYAKKGRGYSEQDYINTVEAIAGRSFTDFFASYVYGTADYKSLLQETLGFAGCMINIYPAKNPQERLWGFKTAVMNGKLLVAAIAPGSTAEKAGLAVDDELLSLNNYRLDATNLADWCAYFAGTDIQLIVSKNVHVKNIKLGSSKEEYYPQYKVELLNIRNVEQEGFFKQWIK